MDEATAVATSGTATPAKRQRAEPAPADTQRNNQSVRVKTESGTLDIPAFAKQWFHNNTTQKQAANVLSQYYSEHEQLFRKVFGKICRNCYAGGRGLKNHNVTQCHSKGNTCYINCPKCNGIRWMQDCKVKK